MPDFSIQPFRPEMQPYRPAEPSPVPPRPEDLPPGLGSLPEVSFRDSIRNFINDVDGLQKTADKKIQDFMAGEISDVHDVMITVEKASTSFQLLLELRNKMMDAYDEIKRMSI